MSRLAAALAALLWIGCGPGPPPELSAEHSAEFNSPLREQAADARARLQASPSSAEAAGGVAMLLHAYGRHDLARPFYERARRLEPDSFRWAYAYGLNLEEEGRQQEAITALSQAVLLDPDAPSVRVALGRILTAAGRPQDALRAYDGALAGKSDSPLAHHGMGDALAAMGKHDDALGHYQKAISLHPMYGAAHYSAAMGHRTMGRAADADRHMKLFERYRGVRPAEPDPVVEEIEALDRGVSSRFARADKLVSIGRSEEAAAELRAALDENPRLVAAHTSLLAIYRELGRLAEAEEHAATALSLEPDNSKLNLNVGLLRFAQGRFAEALEAYQHSLGSNANDPDVHTQIAGTLEKMGRAQEGVAHLEIALREDPRNRQANYLMGLRLLEIGRVDAAVDAFEKTTAPRDGKTPWFLRALAGAYERQGDRVRARATADEGLTLATDLGDAQARQALEQTLAALE